MDRCYWCLKDDNLLNCDICNRIFCNECSKQDYISESRCIVCVVNDFSNYSELKEKDSYSIQEELIYLSQLVADKENINIDNISISELPALFEFLGDNAIQFLSDITKITKCIKRCLEKKQMRFADEILNPLSKFVIRHFMFNAIGSIPTLLQRDSSETQNYNSFISQIINSTKISGDLFQLMPNNMTKNLSSLISSSINNHSNVPISLNDSEPLSLSIGGLSTESFKINEDNDGDDECTDLAEEDESSSDRHTNQFLLPHQSDNLQKSGFINNSNLIKVNPNKTIKCDDFYRRNRHLVPPVNETSHKKNFILVEPCKSLLNQVNNSPSKKWSWNCSIPDNKAKLKRNSTENTELKVPIKVGKFSQSNGTKRLLLSSVIPINDTKNSLVIKKYRVNPSNP